MSVESENVNAEGGGIHDFFGIMVRKRCNRNQTSKSWSVLKLTLGVIIYNKSSKFGLKKEIYYEKSYSL